MTRCISICRSCAQAGLSETRTFEEVRDLVQALNFLMDRAGGIHKARGERNQKASALIDMEDDRAAFGLYLSGNGSVKEGARWHVVQKEKQAHDLLSPKAKAVAIWADAEFITPSSVGTMFLNKSCCFGIEKSCCTQLASTQSAAKGPGNTCCMMI